MVRAFLLVFFNTVPSACHDFKAQDACGGGEAGNHLLHGHGHVAALNADGNTGAAVGGDGLVDGENIRAGGGKNREVAGEDAGIVLQQGVQGPVPVS